jgi:hypothetical protein
MMGDSGNQTFPNTVVDYRAIVQRDRLLRGRTLRDRPAWPVLPGMTEKSAGILVKSCDRLLFRRPILGAA